MLFGDKARNGSAPGHAAHSDPTFLISSLVDLVEFWIGSYSRPIYFSPFLIPASLCFWPGTSVEITNILFGNSEVA
jgi:hypothetical protein